MGHLHDELVFNLYNGTNKTTDNALAVTYVGPSITPLSNLNSGFRMYEVDSGSFELSHSISIYHSVSGTD